MFLFSSPHVACTVLTFDSLVTTPSAIACNLAHFFSSMSLAHSSFPQLILTIHALFQLPSTLSHNPGSIWSIRSSVGQTTPNTKMLPICLFLWSSRQFLNMLDQSRLFSISLYLFFFSILIPIHHFKETNYKSWTHL